LIVIAPFWGNFLKTQEAGVFGGDIDFGAHLALEQVFIWGSSCIVQYWYLTKGERIWYIKADQ